MPGVKVFTNIDASSAFHVSLTELIAFCRRHRKTPRYPADLWALEIALKRTKGLFVKQDVIRVTIGNGEDNDS